MASKSGRRKPLKESYCVITAEVSSANGCPRTWKHTQREASDHAASLIERGFNGSTYRTKRLLVVKVVEVVEVQSPPIIRRSPSVGDVPGQEDD